MNIRIIQKTSESMIKNLPKGQRSQRHIERTASNMSKQMIKLISKTPQEELTTDKYLELLYKVTYPKKPPIIFSLAGDKESDASIKTKCRARQINKHLIEKENIAFELLFKLKNKLIDSPKSVIVHESRHLFDMMCNHKLRLDRGLETLAAKDYPDRVFSWSEIRMEFCDIIPPDKKAYETVLEPYPNAEKIGILRDVRYKIKTEINAYSDEDKMELYDVPLFLRPFYKSLVNFYSMKYFYKDRLKVVEKLLRKYIQEERTTLRSKSACGAKVI